MSKHSYLLVIALVASGCGHVEKLSTCDVACAVDADCPGTQVCSELGLCAPQDETCSCAAGEFITCDGDTAVFCNVSADGLSREACGSAGCNAATSSCNACVPDTVACSADSMMLLRCTDGVYGQGEVCGARCVAGTGGAADHCGHIVPEWLPDVCDEPATSPEATLVARLDTNIDSNCTGGVVDKDGTSFCVVRADKITIASEVKVVGTRALALVADSELAVSGTLDVSADGHIPGPGAANLGAGAASINNSYQGGGGAGFSQVGGRGGGNDSGTPGMAGGPVTDRLTQVRFIGGATTSNAICGNGIVACINAIDFAGGGGGGGALLIACRGQVVVSGTIDAGGGGGTGGGDHYPGANSVDYGGAPGGGSGGYVVLQGAQVMITGKLYANGGGGGGGCATNDCRGNSGTDGLRSMSGAPGGVGLSGAGTGGGGTGGSATNEPGAGDFSFENSSGGGGGSVGQFQIYTPPGVTPIVTPVEASPAPQPHLTISVE